ncbi:unnamed protein product [Phytophthora lilii]|uniref:Unnamed protein product n=1 Tax=Phytophthora lilii TaxID=2077276 RepID=A0A9W6WR15_9STRA|nr:unnamed protein product [Phytophthora lilii]
MPIMTRLAQLHAVLCESAIGKLITVTQLAEYAQVTQLEISDEVESLLVLRSTLMSPDAPPRVLARCFSGEVFCIGGPNPEGPLAKRSLAPWDGPPHGNDGITFVVGDIELGGERGMVALVSMNGLVSLFSSSGERQWDFQVSRSMPCLLNCTSNLINSLSFAQLPEAVVSADKLEMTAAGGDRQDAVRCKDIFT